MEQNKDVLPFESILRNPMQNPHYRYFIELRPNCESNAPRAVETASRREAAQGFIDNIRAWLRERDMASKVSELSVTMFGQVQIACDASIIKLIRSLENDIAAIRQGAIHAEALHRWH